MDDVKVSRRGVYYDLSLSPYEYVTPWGDILKFRSETKLKIYRRDIPKRVKKVRDLIDRNGLNDFITPDAKQEIEKAIYLSFYDIVEK